MSGDGDRPAGSGSGGLDLYFGEPGRPLLVFLHIPKTAGTALRDIIGANITDAKFEYVEIPRMKGDRSRLEAWYQDLLTSLGRRADTLVCAASHSAQYLLPAVSGREIRMFTLLREPVDRALSRYYFFAQEHVGIDELYRTFEQAPRKNRVTRKEAEFVNGQSRRLLAPHFDTASMPRTSTGADADLWRERLFELVDDKYLVGIQDRFLDSVAVFAREFGWTKEYDAQAKVNRLRPSLEDVPDETRELIRTYNWLDEELYRAQARRFGGP